MNVIRTVYFFYLIHTSIILNGQNCLFEKTLPYPCFSTSQPNAIFSADSVNWVISGFVGDCYTAYLAKIDCEGNVIWERYPCGYSKFLDAVPTKNGEILAAGYDWGQDDVGSDEYAVIIKYSTDGTEIFRKYFITHQYDSYFNHVAESSSGEIYVSVDDKVYRLSTLGDSLAHLSFGYGKIRCMLNNHAGELVFGCDSGLVILDSLGNLSEKIPTGAVGAIIQNQQSQYVLSTNGYLTILDSAFTFINSTTLSQVIALEQADSGFFALRRTGILYYDWNLSQASSIWTANGRMNAIDIACNNSQIAVAGTYSVVKNLMLVKGLDYFGNSVESSTDLQLEEVTITDIQKVFRDSIPYGPVIYDLMFSAEAKVINVGIDTIESFNLVSQSFGGMNCSDWRFTFPVSGVHIAPQDTMIYTINRTYYYFYQPNFKLCLHGVSVNGGRDADLSNNSSCSETILLSAGDFEVPPLISVCPNPVSDILHLNLNDSNRGTVEIFSVNGTMLSSLPVNNGITEIDIKHLTPNLYFVRIITSDEKVFCQKVIKL